MPQQYTIYVPGVVQSLGVGAGLPNTTAQTDLSIHGSSTSEFNMHVDGITTRDIAGPGGTLYYINQGYVQEMSVSTGSATAEQQMAGPVSNVIPKDGGNSLHGQVYGHYTDTHFLGDNLTPALQAQGVTVTNSVTKQVNFNPAIGGPLRRDSLWFFGTYLYAGNSANAGILYNATPTAWVYTPDPSRPPASQTNTDTSYALRLTWQESLKNKFSIFVDNQPKYWRNRSITAILAPEAAQWAPYSPQYIGQVGWKSTVSNRFLLEVGAQYMNTVLTEGLNTPAHDPLLGQGAAPDPNAIAAIEDSTGITFRSTAPQGTFEGARSTRIKASASYVSGSHAVKFGTEWDQGSIFVDNHYNGDYEVNLHNGLPPSLILYAPAVTHTNANADLGVFAQDSWTLKRLTLNFGVRYDYLNVGVPVQNEPGNRWVPATTYAAVNGVPSWKDLSPRLGGAYDLFGNGKTAVKASLNRYVAGVGLPLTNVNPVNASILSATRTWSDSFFGAGDPRTGNFLPDCDFSNPAVNGECGKLSNTQFGLANPNATIFDPALRTGYGVRGYNWETSAGIQHQITQGLAVNVSYFRRWFGNFTVQQNLLTTPADFNTYCITAPADPRLPNGGGYPVCGFYDVSQAKFGQTQNLITSASTFGNEFNHFNGIDVTASARFHNGAQISGGSSTGRSEINTCIVVNSPGTPVVNATGGASTAFASSTPQFCDRLPPFQTQWKFLGSYPLPWGLQASGAFQSLPGPEISATSYVAKNSDIASSLGRDLASGATGTATLPLMAPGTVWGDRVNKLDIRFSKTIKVGQMRVQGGLDIYNVFNSSDTLSLNTRYGGSWLIPTQILGARLFRLNAQFEF